METFRKEIKSISDLKNEDGLKSEKKMLQLSTAVLGKSVVKYILATAMSSYVDTVADNTRKIGIKVELNYCAVMAHVAQTAAEGSKSNRRRVAASLIEIQDRCENKKQVREEVSAVALEVLCIESYDTIEDAMEFAQIVLDNSLELATRDLRRAILKKGGEEWLCTLCDSMAKYSRTYCLRRDEELNRGPGVSYRALVHRIKGLKERLVPPPPEVPDEGDEGDDAMYGGAGVEDVTPMVVSEAEMAMVLEEAAKEEREMERLENEIAGEQGRGPLGGEGMMQHAGSDVPGSSGGGGGGSPGAVLNATFGGGGGGGSPPVSPSSLLDGTVSPGGMPSSPPLSPLHYGLEGPEGADLVHVMAGIKVEIIAISSLVMGDGRCDALRLVVQQEELLEALKGCFHHMRRKGTFYGTPEVLLAVQAAVKYGFLIRGGPADVSRHVVELEAAGNSEMIYDALEAMALTALPDQVLSLYKCKAVLEGAHGCGNKLKEYQLDEYAEELLEKSKSLLESSHDMVAMTTVMSLDHASEAMRILNEIHKSKDGVDCLERLEAFALHLLGLETVGEIKVSSIARILEAAMEGCMKEAGLDAMYLDVICSAVLFKLRNERIPIPALTPAKDAVDTLRGDLPVDQIIIIVNSFATTVLGADPLAELKVGHLMDCLRHTERACLSQGAPPETGTPDVRGMLQECLHKLEFSLGSQEMYAYCEDEILDFVPRLRSHGLIIHNARQKIIEEEAAAAAATEEARLAAEEASKPKKRTMTLAEKQAEMAAEAERKWEEAEALRKQAEDERAIVEAYLENKDGMLQRRLTKRWKRAYLRAKEETAREARHQDRRDVGVDSETEEECEEEEEEEVLVSKEWTAEGCAEDLCSLSPEDRLLPLMELELSLRSETVAAMPLDEKAATLFELSIPDRASLLSMMAMEARVETFLTMDDWEERVEVLKELPALHRAATIAAVPAEERLETCRELPPDDRMWLLCEMPLFARAETMGLMEPMERGEEFKTMDPEIKGETIVEIKAQEKLGTPEEELEKLEYKTSFEARGLLHEFAMILIGEEAVRGLKFDALLAALEPCGEVLEWLRSTGPLGPDVPDLFKAVTDAVWDRSAGLEEVSTAKTFSDLLLVAEEVDSTEDKDGDGEIDVGGAEALDGFAIALLGEEAVAELKMKAIMAAIVVMHEILKRPGMGPDAPDLLTASVDALDEDGDGNIGADEYKMLGSAKSEVDKILHAVNSDLDDPSQRPNPGFDQNLCEESLDRLAVHMLGEEKVAQIKIAAIERSIKSITVILEELGHGKDSQELFDAACNAMDADGDGQIDAEEYSAIKEAKHYLDLLIGSWGPQTYEEASTTLDQFSVALMGEEAVALIKVMFMARGPLANCREVLIYKQMDQYSLDILDVVTTSANAGDHVCRTLEESVAVRANINLLNGDKDGDGDVTKEELDLYTIEEADEYLNIVAVGLLGQERVAVVKMEAIKRLMEACKKNLKARGLSDDAVELFSEACENLDKDGDGQIDEEEFKAIKEAKLGMDRLVRAQTILSASDAITEVALALMGPHAVALLKVKAVARAMPKIDMVVAQSGVDEDCLDMLEHIRERVDYQASLSYAEAEMALDADGDGDVDEEEFEAAAIGYNIMESICDLIEKDMVGGGVAAVSDAPKTENELKKRDHVTEMCDQLAINLIGKKKVHAIKNELVQRIIDDLAEDFEVEPTEIDPNPTPEPSLLAVCHVGKAVPGLLEIARNEIDDPGIGLETMRSAVHEAKRARKMIEKAADIMLRFDDGDGEIDEDEMEELRAQGITLAPPEMASDGVDVIAEILLGQDRVTAYKVEAIQKALAECTTHLAILEMGPDVIELFETSVHALDEDGDGQLDAEEMKAVRNASNCVDKIAAAEDAVTAAAAVDKMARVVLGDAALADFKAGGVKRLLWKGIPEKGIASVKTMISEFGLDHDMHHILEYISDCLDLTPAWPLEAITAAKIQTDVLCTSLSAEICLAALDKTAISILGIDEVARIKNAQITVALEASVVRFESLSLLASLRCLREVESVCLRDAIKEIPIPQLTRTKGLLDELVRDDADSDWFIYAVISLCFEVFGDDHTHVVKMEIIDPAFERCRLRMVEYEASDTQLRLLKNAQAAGLRDTPMLEREWRLVVALEASEGIDDVSTAFEALATYLIGDPDSRRGPSTIAIPTGRAGKQGKNKVSLSSVAKSNIKKIQMLSGIGGGGLLSALGGK